MKLRCAVLDDYQQVAESMADWSSLDVETTFLREHLDGDALVAAIEDREILVLMRERTAFPRDLLTRLPKLRLLVTSGFRNASIDLAAAAEQGITVCGTDSGITPPAELTWALILGLARHLVAEDNAFHRGGWQHTIGTDLAGGTLGVIGLGRIGSQIAKVGLAFGMHVLAWSEHLTRERAAESGAELTGSLVDLLARSDIATIHLALSDRTRGLVGAAELAAMRPSAYLVNTARSGIVDTTALVDALRSGRLAGAGLDVFDVEPVPAGDALRALPNVLATPHLGYVTEGNYRTYYREAVEDIAAYLAGSPIRPLR